MAESHGTPARQREQGRVGWIDAARALGACAIVVLHVMVSTELAVDVSRNREVASAVLGIAGCRWAVPAFFMISGLLMLDPERKVTRAHVLSRVRRLLLVIAIFGTSFALMEEVWIRLAEGMEVGLGIVPIAIMDVLTMQTWDHLWFVYALVGVYLTIPLLRWIRERYGQRGHLVLTGVLFVLVLVLPTLNGGHPTSGPLSSFLWNVAVGVTCYCIGWCLHSWDLSISWVFIGVGSLIIMVVVSIAGIGAGIGDQGFVFLQGSCFASLYAGFVLLLLKWFVGDKPLAYRDRVDELARDSFGIYIIHPLFIHVGLLFAGPLVAVPALYEVAFSVAVLAASVASTRVLRRIPLFEDIL